jgi:hypothetical protein
MPLRKWGGSGCEDLSDGTDTLFRIGLGVVTRRSWELDLGSGVRAAGFLGMAGLFFGITIFFFGMATFLGILIFEEVVVVVVVALVVVVVVVVTVVVVVEVIVEVVVVLVVVMVVVLGLVVVVFVAVVLPEVTCWATVLVAEMAGMRMAG